MLILISFADNVETIDFEVYNNFSRNSTNVTLNKFILLKSQNLDYK